MDNNSIDCDLENDLNCPFLNLPEEMFLHICSFLDVKTIVVSLSRVCQKFYAILQSDNLWRSWIAARWQRAYPIVEMQDQLINWKEACYSLEQDWRAWTGELRRFRVDHAHMSDIDAILFLDSPSKCATASRDRRIILWDLDGENPVQLCRKDAHEGWAWRLKIFNQVLFSSSWDYTIKLWDLTAELSETQILRCHAPVLCMNVDDCGNVYGGCCKKAYAFDPRTNSGPIYTVSMESSQPLLTLDIFEDDLILGCENRTISVFDRRTQQLKQTLTLSNSSYPSCSQLLNGALYVGDRAGNVRIYTKKNGELVERAVVDVGFTTPLSAMRVTPGSIVAASSKSAKARLPLKPTYPVAEFCADGGIVSGMDAYLGRVALGTSTSVEFWLPTSL